MSLFPGLFKPILAWNEAPMIFFNFLNFFALFFEFSITPRVRMKRNDNFYFLSFSVFSNQFWLEMNPQWYFLIFQIFLEFSSVRLEGTKRNNNFYFLYFSYFSDLFWLEMNHNGISFIFWIFYYFYGIFNYASGRNETKR